MRESLPLLLTESLDPVRRETALQHVETCAACGQEWLAVKETWAMLGTLPQVAVPDRVRARFLSAVDPGALVTNVVPFHRRPAVRWLSQAAAVVVIAGGAWFAGQRTAPVRLAPQEATIGSSRPLAQPIYSIAETRVLPARSISPDIEGRPNIANVQFTDADASDGQIGVAFDITSHVTMTGSPTDKSMVRLLSYVLQSDSGTSADRSRTIEWVRQTYADASNADPEIAQALGKVLRNTEHEGVRLKAADTLMKMPAGMTSSGDSTRDAIIEALKNDPNPAVRIKAVEALAKLAGSGERLDADEVDTLRQKASQDGENLYVRVKAAEALSKIHPE